MPKIEQIEALLKHNPKDAFLRFALAKEYEKANDDERAKAAYEALIADQPDYIGTYYHLGKTLERMGDISQAFKVYTQGMETAKRLGEKHALSELAGARLEIGDEDDFA